MDKLGAGNQRRYSGSDSVTKTVSQRKNSVPTTGFHDVFRAEITRPVMDEKRTKTADRPGSSFGEVNLDLVDIKLDEDETEQPRSKQSASAISSEPTLPSPKPTLPNGFNSDKHCKRAWTEKR